MSGANGKAEADAIATEKERSGMAIARIAMNEKGNVFAAKGHENTQKDRISETELRDVGSNMAGWNLVGSAQKFDSRTASNYIQDTFKIEFLEDRDEEIKQTQALKLVAKATESKSKSILGKRVNGARGTRNTRTIEGELLGIRYRVYLPTPNGNWAMMEFAEPKRLIKPNFLA